jgi:hypothetical protein
MSETSIFRGYHAIKEVVEYMAPLAEWMARHKPEIKELTLKGPDFDLLKRWPKAAGMFDVSQFNGELSYKGFHLKRDKKPFRYSKNNPEHAR